MGGATDREHDTEESPEGNATVREGAGECHRHRRRACDNTIVIEEPEPHKVIQE